ncbi:MAG: hypothetical protein WBZ36_02095, partial [Candidatus Nitrosopolaris sp.]
ISIIKSIAAILVSTPKSRANPPITSNNAIITAISGGNQNACEKKCWVPGILTSLGVPCAINIIPVKTLIGRGPYFINFP